MFKKFKWIIYTRAFIKLVYYVIQFYSMTLRLSVKNEKQWQDLLSKRPVLLCTWHQQFFAAIRHFRKYKKYNPGLMISRSRDGELIAGVANKAGWSTPRGSSSRGGRQAMAEMIQHLQKYGLGAHVLDGPTGPIGIVKPGIIRMAQSVNAIVVPFYVKAEQAWYFNSWDHFMLPKPFSKVELIFDLPFDVNGTTGRDVFEAQRRELEDRMKPGLVLEHRNPVI